MGFENVSDLARNIILQYCDLKTIVTQGLPIFPAKSP
ncbi:Protein CBG26657 [Caenorhabditis briggsae]|uniref:Protein CBG26657 n=1 Tax=Caenorhabditis briggsae TaxID=6238 RepID=B6IE20_CAEBR|nr:Protein CBG26657 [Caenorhabditis briggsae]CAS01084.1 Protein CBG26657 [Caenorhabditis briggsae]